MIVRMLLLIFINCSSYLGLQYVKSYSLITPSIRKQIPNVSLIQTPIISRVLNRLEAIPSIPSKQQKTRNLISRKEELIQLLQTECQPNGIKCSNQQRQQVSNLVVALESLNPTSKPALSLKMNGFWRLLYTDFSPVGTSAGQLGPFIGDVFQDLDGTNGVIKNLLSISFPPIQGGLVANQAIKDNNTWEIAFDRVGNYFAGWKLSSTKFPVRKEIRLWDITFLDDELRIMRARRDDRSAEESFIFVLIRDEASRFSIDL